MSTNCNIAQYLIIITSNIYIVIICDVTYAGGVTQGCIVRPDMNVHPGDYTKYKRQYKKQNNKQS